MSSYKTLDALAAEMAGGSIILIRADLNVPLDERGAVRDATRLERLLPVSKNCRKAAFASACCRISDVRKASAWPR